MGDYKPRLKDKKICIYRLVPGEQDKDGFRTGDTYKKVHDGKLWAHYRQTSADEYFTAMANQYAEDVIFTINWRKDINPLIDVILYNGNVYEISRVDDYEGYKQDIKISAKRSQKRGLADFPGIEIK